MSKKTKAYTLDPFQEWAHNFGRIGMAAFFLYMLAIPTVMAITYDAFPEISLLVTACVGICVTYIPIGISETLSYVPIFGSSSYLAFTTGNMMNLKLPCAKNALTMAEVDQGTPEGDAVAAVAIAASSMLTVVIIAIGVLLIVPLQPILTWGPVAVAKDYMLPALFGTFFLGLFAKDKGEYVINGKMKGLIVPFVIGCLLALFGILIPGLEGVFILILLPITILSNRILFNKGIVTVDKNPDFVPLFEKDKEEK